jgi:hypothetical protein
MVKGELQPLIKEEARRLLMEVVGMHAVLGLACSRG